MTLDLDPSIGFTTINIRINLPDDALFHRLNGSVISGGIEVNTSMNVIIRLCTLLTKDAGNPIGISPERPVEGSGIICH